MAGRRRVPWLPLLAYGLSLFCLAALLDRPQPAVVPAVAGLPHQAASPPGWLVTDLPNGFWHSVLRAALPSLPALSGPAPPWPDLSVAIEGAPYVLLRLALPGLASLAPPPAMAGPRGGATGTAGRPPRVSRGRPQQPVSAAVREPAPGGLAPSVAAASGPGTGPQP